jgi:hypothetical protein
MPRAPVVPEATSVAEILRVHQADVAERSAAAAADAATLAAVPVTPADADALAADFGLPAALASRVLRLAGGDAKLAARRLLGLE